MKATSCAWKHKRYASTPPKTLHPGHTTSSSKATSNPCALSFCKRIHPQHNNTEYLRANPSNTTACKPQPAKHHGCLATANPHCRWQHMGQSIACSSQAGASKCNIMIKLQRMRARAVHAWVHVRLPRLQKPAVHDVHAYTN